MKKALLTLLFLSAALSAQEMRIVSLSPAMTELVWYLGKGPAVVGRSEVCDFPPEVRTLPVVGKFADPHMENILRTKPTHIVTNDLINPGAAKIFGRHKIKTVLHQVHTISDYRRCLLLLGKELNISERIQSEIEHLDKAAVPAPALNKKALWVIWDSPLMTAGKGSFPEELMTLAGVENVAKDVPQTYFKCSYEFLLKHQPDVIIWTAGERSLSQLRKHRFWNKLKAVQNGKVIFLDARDPIQRPGPRMFERLKFLRKKLEEL